jgi:hypothetical protein
MKYVLPFLGLAILAYVPAKPSLHDAKQLGRDGV